MPVRCTFSLNNNTTSALYSSGFGTVTAYSGQKWGRDNPMATATPEIGPIPEGTYYIVDRQSGGTLGWARDLWSEYGYGTTDRTKWFALWNPNTGDTTVINGIRRGNFRLHPEGPQHLSEGCITVVSHQQFDQLRRFIRSHKADLSVPGSALRAYGTVDVR
ncbi:DUF2778 domain-containing protein [Paraburkholderia sp. UYCP14C]|uniref:DUF2778 domain-containing protein n=1 Tax=Paraburkholderia sp. UYCP14C TaxID=2511130 RepID=UPI001021A4C3|nr:DUF2778 domain-containing protein [Paraburkholderia sp. UYCP14C]RZF30798.1 DUF2778 domain-containing protein [Paraburkholderia sp. UYCP14C]